MELDKVIIHTSWLISALKEQAKYLHKEMKYASSFSLIKNSSIYVKSMYHFNLFRVLLNQVDKSYANLMNKSNFNPFLINLKNTYFQRCVFQFSLAFSYYKEVNVLIDNISHGLNASLLFKLNNINSLLDKTSKQIDIIIAKNCK